jgi:hypothetical protein
MITLLQLLLMLEIARMGEKVAGGSMLLFGNE